MDPFVAASQNGHGPADVVIETLESAAAPRAGERQNPARDGTVTLTGDGRLFVLAGGRACSVPDAAQSGPAGFAAQGGFPPSAGGGGGGGAPAGAPTHTHGGGGGPPAAGGD